MGRPRAKENAKRTRRLIVRLTDEDRAAICANAQKAGLRLSEYVRRVAVAGHIVHVQQSGYGMALAHQLRHIGVNLNQLMPIAHLNGEVPPEMDSVFRKLETLLDRILRTT
jgi:hypothetical protein